jgi:hypothetical protein
MHTPSALLRQTNAMQRTAAAALFAIALVTLPLLAESPNGMYADQLIRRFEKTGAIQGQSFDNRFIDTNAFDFAQYFSHTCFRPTEYDIPACQREFGPYWNLQQTLVTGQLAEILARRTYLAGAEKAVVPVPVQKVYEPRPEPNQWTPATTNDDAKLQKQRDARSKVLWSACQKRSSDRSEAGRCYRRNIRLLSEESSALNIESSVY